MEDPVGPSPLDPEGGGHHGHDGIGRFWDRNFGSVSRFHFRITDSFANGPCCANIASITMWLGEGGTTMTVDGVMIYTINDDGLITSIRGYWEPDRAMATITSPAWASSSRWPSRRGSLDRDPQRQVTFAMVLLGVVGAPGVQQLRE